MKKSKDCEWCVRDSCMCCIECGKKVETCEDPFCKKCYAENEQKKLKGGA